jgi:hypothetical protein
VPAVVFLVIVDADHEGCVGELRAENASIILMIQADMIGYLAPGEPPQLGLPYS